MRSRTLGISGLAGVPVAGLIIVSDHTMQLQLKISSSHLRSSLLTADVARCARDRRLTQTEPRVRPSPASANGFATSLSPESHIARSPQHLRVSRKSPKVLILVVFPRTNLQSTWSLRVGDRHLNDLISSPRRHIQGGSLRSPRILFLVLPRRGCHRCDSSRLGRRARSRIQRVLDPVF